LCGAEKLAKAGAVETAVGAAVGFGVLGTGVDWGVGDAEGLVVTAAVGAAVDEQAAIISAATVAAMLHLEKAQPLNAILHASAHRRSRAAQTAAERSWPRSVPVHPRGMQAPSPRPSGSDG